MQSLRGSGSSSLSVSGQPSETEAESNLLADEKFVDDIDIDSQSHSESKAIRGKRVATAFEFPSVPLTEEVVAWGSGFSKP